MSRSRDIAAFLGKTEITNTENNALLNTASPTGLDSARVSSIAASSGLTVYSTLNDLPSSGLTSGDQAFVSSTSRFYISNGSGWYNVALINATPSLTIDPTGTITLATDGVTPTVITLTATDSDNPIAALTYSVESDGSFGGLATISQDSSVFTITPFSEDSATTTTSTLTFKASDGISFGSGTRTLTLSFKVQYSNYTTLLTKADTTGTDNQVDASTNAVTITENGNVTSTAFTPYHPGGYSVNFNDGYYDIAVTDSTDFDFGTGDFTMEGWYYCTNSTTDNYLLSFSTASGNGHFGVNFYQGSWRVGLFNGSLITGTTGVESNVWHHFAWVRESGVFKFYIDGTQVGSDVSYSSALDCSGTFKIGAYQGSVYGGFWGYLSDIRIIKGTAIYTGNFTTPTGRLSAIANTVLLACHLPYFADGSSSNHTLTPNPNSLVNGDLSIKRFGPHDYLGYGKADHGGSVYFDGNGDYLGIPDDDGFELTGDFAIECWFYRNSVVSGTYCSVIGGNGSSTNGWNIYITNSNGAISFFHGSFLLTYAEGVRNNTWYHVAVTRSGTDLKLFVNGIERDSATNSSTFNQNDGNLGTRIGYDINANGYFNGYVTDARVVKGSAVYTAVFTPPTEPLTAITNTQLLTCTNKNSIWDASASPLGLITVGGTAAASNTQRKFTSSSAIAYDGNSDYLQIPANDFFNFGTDDFTMETWVYAVATGANYPAFMSSVTGWSAGANGHRFDNINYANKFAFYVNGFSGRAGGNPFMHTTNNFNHDTWYHYAVTRSGSTFRMFIDGVLEDTQTSAGSLNIALGGFRSGWSFDGANGYFNGYIQDMRITRGVARYTATFTPPAAEFTG